MHTAMRHVAAEIDNVVVRFTVVVKTALATLTATISSRLRTVGLRTELATAGSAE
jgi:hypothetical protein